MTNKTYVKGTCRKCRATVRIEVNGQSIDEIKDGLANMRGYQCPGQHMELSAMLGDYDWDWTPFEAPEPLTDEEFGRKILEEYGRDRVFFLGNAEVGKALGIPNLNTVRDIDHIGFGYFGNREHIFTRHDSPRGMRFYVRERR